MQKMWTKYSNTVNVLYILVYCGSVVLLKSDDLAIALGQSGLHK